MKHSTYHYIMGLLATCLLSATFASCTREADEPVADGRTATIRLDIPMLEADTRVDVAGDENAIHQLRVIILSQGATSINQTFTADDLTDGSITISNVPVGPVQMYVIANETSMGRNYDDLATLKNEVITLPNTQTKKVLILDEQREHFPLRGSKLTADGLPMTWMNKSQTIEPPTDTPQTIEVQLVRAVAKLNIQMNNALTTPITIDKMSFGPFFGDRLYLFAEGTLDVPNETPYETQYTSHDFPLPTGEKITIEGGKNEQLVLYIYPSFAWKNPNDNSPYTIGFHTEAGITYPQMAFVKGGTGTGALNSIARNTQVNIYATLSAPANVNIDFEVVKWEEKTVNVPSFN